MKFETLIKQLVRESLNKANARTPNGCDDCGYTWTPRGKELSARCPNCQSPNVKLLVPEKTGCAGALAKLASCGVICFLAIVGLAFCSGIFGDLTDRNRNPKKKIANSKTLDNQNQDNLPPKNQSSKAPEKASLPKKPPVSTTKKSTKPVKKRLINYEIIKRDQVPSFTESYDIRVGLVDGRLPNKGELAAISAKLRNRSFDKTFVCFYLP
ncbi:MAG: hypothetical protein VX438_17190, partial [Planctomycetota bacterium]|nr:hypothetical protein [Planctomycetota bacterium]